MIILPSSVFAPLSLPVPADFGASPRVIRHGSTGNRCRESLTKPWVWLPFDQEAFLVFPDAAILHFEVLVRLLATRETPFVWDYVSVYGLGPTTFKGSLWLLYIEPKFVFVNWSDGETGRNVCWSTRKDNKVKVSVSVDVKRAHIFNVYIWLVLKVSMFVFKEQKRQECSQSWLLISKLKITFLS